MNTKLIVGTIALTAVPAAPVSAVGLGSPSGGLDCSSSWTTTRDAAPVPAIRWSMPPRAAYDDGLTAETSAAPLALEPAEVAEPAVASLSPEAANPAGYSLRLVADPAASLVGSSPVTSLHWSVSGSSLSAPLEADGCSFQTPAVLQNGATYQVSLTAVDAAGGRGTAVTAATVRDMLIVSIGDSYASGEGAPDQAYRTITVHEDDALGQVLLNYMHWPRPWGPIRFPVTDVIFPQWMDNDQRQIGCHQSLRSGPAMAARAIEDLSDHTSVTFVPLACSGATTVGHHRLNRSFRRAGFLYFTSYTYTADIYSAVEQIDQAKALLKNRPIDAVLLSIGGNDMGFAQVIGDCARGDHCQNDAGLASQIDAARVALNAPGGGYDQVADKLSDPELRVAATYITEAPDILRTGQRATDFFCGNDELLMNPFQLAGLGDPRFRQAAQQLGLQVPDHIMHWPLIAWFGDDEARFLSDRFLGQAAPVAARPEDTHGLNGAMSFAAKKHDWVYVGGISDRFAYGDSGEGGHGYCAVDNWIHSSQSAFDLQHWDLTDYGIDGLSSGVMHPNYAGSAVIGEQLVRAIDDLPHVEHAVNGVGGTNGWFRSAVEVVLKARDAHGRDALIESISYRLDGGAEQTQSANEVLVPLSGEGEHVIQVKATTIFGRTSGVEEVRVKIDTVNPTVTCNSADGQWHAQDAEVTCAASDATSGLLKPADSSVTLRTSVPDGVETDNAVTGTYAVFDAAGNRSVAGPVAGNKVDKKAPTIGIVTPADQGVYLLDEVVTVDFACSDGGSGVQDCLGDQVAGSRISTASTGARTFSVAARDNVGNGSGLTTHYSVTYGICPNYYVEKPLGKAGAVVKLQTRLCNVDAERVWLPSGKKAQGLAKTVLTAATLDQGAAPAPPNRMPDHPYGMTFAGRPAAWSDDMLRVGYDYRYDLATTSLGAGSHTLQFRVTGDPIVHTLQFVLR